MKTITIIGCALGIMLGAATTASATNQTSCEHSQQQATYHCNSGGTEYTVKNAASAEAAAAAVATAIAQGGAGGDASATGGTAVASNGGNSVNISSPKTVKTLGLGVTADVGDLMRAKTDNLAKIVTTIDGASDKCMAAAIMNESPALFNWRSGKRLTIRCD